MAAALNMLFIVLHIFMVLAQDSTSEQGTITNCFLLIRELDERFSKFLDT